MRISDWSSDVCSSDLYRKCATVKPAATSCEKPPSSAATCSSTSETPGLTCVTSWRPSALSQPPPNTFEPSSRTTSSKSLLGTTRSCARGSIRYPNANRFWKPSRSEEHTSELQSLMRISYAVFCLKKKKKKYTN